MESIVVECLMGADSDAVTAACTLGPVNDGEAIVYADGLRIASFRAEAAACAVLCDELGARNFPDVECLGGAVLDAGSALDAISPDEAALGVELC